ncbi:DUF6197 family protein [Actinoplanes couchii]|uniref:Uncharacterized protein n=1 Tax=Actinoplanes couchii TaxID=403638 RepID=A0ABQ3X3H8_9ACTN|nr:hypothetical protein [Actinoplanes couchii]MDR6322788.1 hypothetical protein [Actinoplanes couchii]GID53027.1 hypothetical protein Aco03nite_014310 [Actinoplanes couchii]
MNPTQNQVPDSEGITAPVPAEQNGFTDLGGRLVEDPADVARLLPDVVTRPGGHHPECCCPTCQGEDQCDQPIGFALTAAGLLALGRIDEAAEVWGDDELDQDRIPTAEGFAGWRERMSSLASADGSAEQHDADWAEGYGERLIDAYTSHYESADAREVTDDGDEPGSVPNVLRSAATYLERHGWIQGAYYDATSGVFTPSACMVGAIGMACYGGPVDVPAQMFDQPGFAEFEQAVLHLDRYLLVHHNTESYAFNDARGRTVGEVIDALRTAAEVPAEELVETLRAIDEMDDRLADSGLTFEQIVALLRDGDGELANLTDCQLCGAPGGYPYCEGNYGGRVCCADVARSTAEGGDA